MLSPALSGSTSWGSLIRAQYRPSLTGTRSVVKFRDWTMKTDLLKMIEWHARATQGDQLDVWYIGTKMPN